MSLDSLLDPPIAAIAALIKGAANADVDANAIDAALGFPVPPGSFPSTRLPLLSVYRETDAEIQHTSGLRLTISTVRIDYVAPETSLERSASRWPLLRSVWVASLEALRAGRHPAVALGVDVLRPAGVVWVEDSAPPPRVRYLWPATGGRVFPSFQATIEIATEKAIDLSAFPAVSGLLAEIDLDGFESNPFVSDLITP